MKKKEYRYDEIGTNEVGTIQLNSKVYVTDPCYNTNTWCQAFLKNVSPGEYKCFVVVLDEGPWGHRVAELHAVKKEIIEKYQKLEDIPYLLEPLSCTIGVDSGQCGIFDADYYEKHQPDDDYNDSNSWYRRVCELTSNAGITDSLGVAAASGYGDGSYPLFVVIERNNVVAMKIVFIRENEDDLEEE